MLKTVERGRNLLVT